MSWSLYYEACVDCSATERKHIAHGLCSRCYKRCLRAGTRPRKRSRPWSSIAPACVVCGRTDQKHRARGLCRTCYSTEYRATEHGKLVCQKSMQRYAATEGGQNARRECNRRWLERPDNREKDRQLSRRTREREYGIDVVVPLGYEDLVFAVFGKHCASCGASGQLVLDHHRPLQAGHALLHNAVPLCRICNVRKNKKLPEDFYDGWALAEIMVGLHDVRDRFELEAA